MRPALLTALTALCLTLNAFAQSPAASPDTLHWNSTHALKAGDFKMAPLDFPGVAGEAVCLLLVNYKQKSPLSKPEYHTRASFDRAKSWVLKDSTLDENLRYFQVMFDLYELHARMLQKDLTEHTPASGIDAFMQERYNAALGATMDEFNQFRRESKMGHDRAAVTQWSQRVRRDIAAMAAYASEGTGAGH